MKGRTRIEGNYGAPVRLDNMVVPPSATFSLDGENGTPDLAAVFEVRDGRPECVRFSIEAKAGGRGIRTADLQTFNVDAMVRAVFAEVAMTVTVTEGEGYVAYDLDWSLEPTDTASASREVGRARSASRGGPNMVELARVARVYRQYEDNSPTAHVQSVIPYNSYRTAARRVEQAREAGLLPPTTPGKRKA